MKHRIVYLFMCMALVVGASAQKAYRSSELRRLSSVLDINDKSLKEGYNYLTVNQKPIIVIVRNNTISHIGLHLFSEEIRQIDNTPVFDFLERYFLQLNYPPTDRTAKKMATDDQFRFLTGNLQAVDNLKPSDSFSFSYDKRRYEAEWKREGKTTLSVSFPVEYELMSGENKIEAENNLITDIQNTDVKDVPAKPAKNAHYISKKFSSRLYYQKGSLISSERHPAETVANMMLSANAKGSYDMKITQVSYGFTKTTFSVPLRQWIAFCQKNNCQLFVGIEDINDKGDVSAVVIAVNEAENYNHVLTVTVPYECFQTQTGCVEAKLYPYVPMHNVRNMFSTNYKKSNPKIYTGR